MVASICFWLAAQRKKIISLHETDAFGMLEPSSRDESNAFMVDRHSITRSAALKDAGSMEVREKRGGRSIT